MCLPYPGHRLLEIDPVEVLTLLESGRTKLEIQLCDRTWSRELRSGNDNGRRWRRDVEGTQGHVQLLDDLAIISEELSECEKTLTTSYRTQETHVLGHAARY